MVQPMKRNPLKASEGAFSSNSGTYVQAGRRFLWSSETSLAVGQPTLRAKVDI